MKPTTRRACHALALLVTAGLATFAVAQTATAPTSQPQVQFKVVDSPFEVASSPGDPALEYSEYVAVFRGGMHVKRWSPLSGGESRVPQPGAGFGSTGGGPVSPPPGGMGGVVPPMSVVGPPGSASPSSPMMAMPRSPTMAMLTGRLGSASSGSLAMGEQTYPNPSGFPMPYAGPVAAGYFNPGADVDSWLREMVNMTPKDRLSSDRIRALLSTQTPGVVRIRWVPADVERKGPATQPITGPDGVQYVETEMVMEFQILATRPQQAEELARALFTAYDYGFVRPVQVMRREELAVLQRRLDDAREKFAKAAAKQMELDSKLQKIEDVDPEALKELKKQRWLLTVQITGAKARMDAAKSQVTASPADQVKNRQLEEITIATSIELAGLLASQDRIEKLISQGSEREELTTQRNAAKAKVDATEQAMYMSGSLNSQMIPDRIKELQAGLENLKPLETQISVVNIYPIKRPTSSGTTPSVSPSAQPMAPGMGMPSPASPMMTPAR